MKIRYLFIIAMLWVSTLVAQSSPSAVAKASFAGTWEGFMNDLPGLKITIQQNVEQVEGTAVFYFQSLGPDKQWHVNENDPAVPLLDPKLKDNVLSFEVPHHKCHGCTELGPNVKFVMKLTDAHEALLYQIRNDSKDGSPSGEGLRLIAVQTPSAAHENSFETGTHAGMGPTMRKGVTVEMPFTRNAVPVPKADNEDSLIVTVTYDGNVYLGVDPISTSEITEKMKDALSNRADKTLYVRVDARTPYVDLVRVFDSVRAAGAEGLTLLTAQQDNEEPGTLVPPKGLELLVVPLRLARNSSASK